MRFRNLLFGLISIFIFGESCFAIAQSNETPMPCEPIRLANMDIACLSNGIGSFSARDRSSAITQKIQGIASDLTFDIDNIKSVQSEKSSDIIAGEVILLSLRDEDLDIKVAPNRKEMSERIVDRIKVAIRADRTQKSPEELMWSVGYSLLATLVLLILFIGFSRIYPKIYAALHKSNGRYIRTLSIQSFELLNASRIVGILIWLVRFSRVVLTLLALYFYIPLVLSFFPWTATWAPKIFGYVLNPIRMILHVAADYIPNLFFIVIIAIITKYSLKLMRFFFQEIEHDRLHFEGFYREWSEPTYKLVRVIVLAFALVVIFPYLPGSSSPAFQGISVFLGLLLSMGSSSAVANLVAGVVLTYMRPFKEGDRVKIADTIGDIIEKTLLVTRIRSIKNVEITIPNSMVLGSHIINYSTTAEKEGLVLNTTVTIGYDASWRQIHELLIKAALSTKLVSKDKTPFVLQTALNDFYVAYELNAYTNSPNRMATIYSELHQNIQDCFNEAGVEIMSPHYSALRDGNETTIPPSHRS